MKPAYVISTSTAKVKYPAATLLLGLARMIPFHLKQGMVWIAARAVGHSVNGIIDSDSPETFLDPQTAKLFKPKDSSDSKVPHDASSRIAFQLGDVTLVSEKPVAAPIKSQFPDMDFILGFDAVGKDPFTVNYSERTIEFGDVPPGPRTPFLEGTQVPSVTVNFLSRSVCALVDTGAPCGLDIPFEWVASNIPRTIFDVAIQRKDLGPNFEALPFKLDTLDIADNKLTNVRAEAIRRRTPSSSKLEDTIWGNLGNDVLARFDQIGIDGPRRNCVFKMN